jgi:aspartate/methionine/tyrosine aminotransferase
MPDLRAAIAHAFGTEPESVLVSDGASLAGYTALLAVGGAGARVVVEDPTYASLAEIPRLHGAEVVRWRRRPEDGWLPRMDELRAIRDAGPIAAVVLTRLHNPSGVDLPADFLEELAGLAEAGDFRVVLDEVYLDFLPDAVPGFRFSPRFLSTGSLTKVHGFGGLRVGWILSHPETLRPLRELSYYLAVNTSAPSQALGAAVLRENGRWLERARRLAAEGRAVFEEWLAGRSDASWVPADGGLNAFVRLPAVKDTHRFAEQLREEHGVSLAAGEYFGMPGWVRISYSAPVPALREALRRTGVALDGWSAPVTDGSAHT